MQTKTHNPLPKTPVLPGAVCVQWRRCGKPNCRCRDGVSLHGPYYAHFWRQNGKLCKRYVRQPDVAALQQACGRHREQQAQQRRRRDEGRELLHRLRQMLRDVEEAA